MSETPNRKLEAVADWMTFPDTADRRTCDACKKSAKVSLLAQRDDGDVRIVFVCKGHLLDPGPLLDY